MSTSFPDTNLPANYRPPSTAHRASTMKREDSPPPPNDELPLANIFASILDDEFSLGQSARPTQASPFYTPAASPHQRPYPGPYIVGESTPHAKHEKADLSDTVLVIKRVRDDDKDGVVFFFSAKYRKPFFVILIIFLMAATGNLSEIIQFIVKYL
ncbi:MAG: hypothetical protein EHM39_02665 [Chloroflexi bacterium]|nr:MAG: hypothetical protein EHM39_02665 [Chloroflexota bacterium]